MVGSFSATGNTQGLLTMVGFCFTFEKMCDKPRLWHRYPCSQLSLIRLKTLTLLAPGSMLEGSPTLLTDSSRAKRRQPCSYSTKNLLCHFYQGKQGHKKVFTFLQTTSIVRDSISSAHESVRGQVAFT